jgi:hypothetical protein
MPERDAMPADPPTSSSTPGEDAPFDPSVGQGPLALRALMSGLVDYAGLFPPAKLAMEAACANYARYSQGARSWMLGRFICPVAKLEEFRKASAAVLPRSAEDAPWRVSALIDGDLDENLDAIFAFNAEHEEPDRGLAVIDGVEIKVPATDSTAFIDNALELVPDELFPFFEFPSPAAVDPRGLAAALAGADAGAKIRTGGVTAEAFPPAGAIADFLLACAGADIPFKATAGLHHPVRATYRLTYEPGCATGTMYGFLNVFIAAAGAFTGVRDRAKLVRVLEESDPKAFTFTDGAAGWREAAVPLGTLHRARTRFMLSFGSCSFEEPVEDLEKLGLI